VRNTTAPLLVAYAGLLLLTLTLPLDLTANPTELFKRLREKTTWVPLGELFDRPSESGEHDLKVVANWCELYALYLPLGLLAGGLAGKFRTADGLFRVVGLGLLAGLVGEACQVLVMSRHPSLTDVLLAAAGVTTGWAAARILALRGVRKRRAEVALLLGQAWSAVLAVLAWHPYQFYPAVTDERLGAMSWLPLRDAVRGQYLWAAEDLLAKFALAVPLGAVVAWGLGGSPPAKRRAVWLTAAAATGLVAAALELGQAMLPARTVCPTDVLLATAGGWAGAAVTRRLGGR
jgi:glycopeptide antibiotics resistance protein